MGALTPGALRNRIASGDLDPVYLLVGEDEHEKAALAAALVDTIDGLRAFKSTVPRETRVWRGSRRRGRR